MPASNLIGEEGAASLLRGPRLERCFVPMMDITLWLFNIAIENDHRNSGFTH